MPSESQRIADEGFRIQHKFWLQALDQDEANLITWLHEKKQTRDYTSTIRKALELVHSLEKGDTSVLEREYGWLSQSETVSPPTAPVVPKQPAGVQWEQVDYTHAQPANIKFIQTPASSPEEREQKNENLLKGLSSF